jgi:hypothetical protein
VSAGSSPRPQPVTDVSAARWVGIGDFGSGVRGLLPAAFDAYARILHPDPPLPGEPPPALLSALCEHLRAHTASADRCWFCLWEGYGWIEGSPVIVTSGNHAGEAFASPPAFEPEVINGPRVCLPGRKYILFTGPLGAALETGWRSGELLVSSYPHLDFDPASFDPQPPNLFWPHDRGWCVASEIDLESTYLGGPADLVSEVIADARLEAQPVQPDDPVEYSSDQIDP